MIELIKNRDGVWNFSSLRPVATAAGTAAQPEQARSFSLGSLSVEDGQVALTDRQAERRRALYSNIDLTLTDLAPDTPFSFELGVQLPGEGTQQVTLDGTGGPIPRGKLAATPFRGTLALEKVRLSSLRQFLGDARFFAASDGTITGQTKIDAQSDEAGLQGEMRIEDLAVHGRQVGYPIKAQYIIGGDLETSSLTIQEGNVQFGSTLVSLSGTVETTPNPAKLNLNVKAGKMSLAEAIRLAPAFGLTMPTGAEIKGTLEGELQVRGTTARPALDGVMSAAAVEISGGNIRQPIEIQSVRFQFNPTTIQSNDFGIKSGETTIRSNIAIRAYTSSRPVLDARLEAPAAQFSAVAALARAYGVTALNNVSGEGTLSLDFRLAGPVSSLTGDSVLRALNGRTKVAFDNVRVSGTNLAQEISTVAGFLKPTGSGEAPTSISKMTGTISIRNGVAQTDDLEAKLDLGTIAVKGSADLVTHTLNLRVNSIVSREVSQQAGGTGIGGYLQTALANDQGELVVPVRVTGTFESPKVSPDLQAVAEMKLKGVLPDSGNPAAGLAGAIGDVLTRRSEDQKQQSEPPSSQENPAKSTLEKILEGISGPKQKQEEEPQRGE